MDAVKPDWRVYRLGLQPYQAVWDAMERPPAARGEESGADQLWLLQHYPVYTLGQAGGPDPALSPGHSRAVRCKRGPPVTHH